MPKQDITVRELIDKVERGDLTLPEMQRRYVWTQGRVRDLLDSLYRGYPSGTILVWETDEDIDTRKLSVETGPQSSYVSQQLLLLDGQQRITSLSAVINGRPIMVKYRKRPIDILFNLEHPDGPPTEVFEVNESDTKSDVAELESQAAAPRDIQAEMRKRTFVVSSPVLRRDPIWVSVSEIFTKTDREILKPLGINSDDERWDKYADRLSKVRKIKEYQYVMQVLQKDMPYEEVTEIFVRVNSLGAKLRSSDLALAQITSKWRGFMEVMEDFSNEFGDDAEYVTDWLAVRMITVFGTKQALYKAVNRMDRKGLEDAWEKAKRGIHFAVNFIRNNAGFESLSHLSASMLVVPIAVYAVLHDEKLSPEEERKLLKWFYYAHMRGHYGMGSSETLLNADLAPLFNGGSIDDLIEVLFNHVKRFEVRPQELAGKGVNSPFFTMLYTIFREQGAKDWMTGIKLSNKSTGSHAIQFHHIFPKSLLQKAGLEPRDINEIANLAFIGGKTNRQILNKPPIVYMENSILPKNGKEPLVSQAIPLERGLWEMDAYPAFLETRRAMLSDLINDYMEQFEEQRKAADNSETLIAMGESDTLEFKSSLRWSMGANLVDKKLESVIVKTITAFSNAQGGTLLIGVDDVGNVLGLDKDYASLRGDKDAFELHLRNVLKSAVGSAFGVQNIKVTFPIVQNKEICRIDVTKAATPQYAQIDGSTKFYTRNGNSSIELPVSEVSQYIAQRF